MNRPGISRTLFLSLVLMTVGFLTQSAFAAGRGGGGGGGFHGGGGGGFHGGGGGGFHGGGGYGGGFHGGGGGGWHGGGYGGWHGGGYNGYRGGYGGWHGGYGGWRGGYGYGGWGCCGWGWGFGVSLNFGWPYGGYYGYPYGYGYYPYSYYPYPYAYNPYPYYYAPVNNSTYDSPANNSTAADYSNAPYDQAGGDVQNSAPAAQFSASVPRPPTLSNSVAVQDAIYRPGASSYTTASAAQGGAIRRPVSAQSEFPATRPEVQNVIRALRSMPPAARQRQIDSGRYSNLSPQELRLVRSAADVPL